MNKGAYSLVPDKRKILVPPPAKKGVRGVVNKKEEL